MKRLLILLTLFLTACTSMQDLKESISEKVFGRQKVQITAPLPNFKPQLTAKLAWSTQIGQIKEGDFVPAISGDAVYAANSDGDVYRFAIKSGKLAWKTPLNEALSSGVGASNGLVLVGTARGQIIALNNDGQVLWKAKVGGEVLSAPQTANNIVVARAGDGRIYGIEAQTGKRKWVYERSMPALVIKSNAGIVIADGVAYAGFAGGRLVALHVADGTPMWEVVIATPKGSTEIERITDITSTPDVEGGVVYIAAYQGRVAAIDRLSGRPLWFRDISSYAGLSSDTRSVYVSHSEGSIYSLDSASGKSYWRQGDLMHRQPTAPLVMDHALAVGDGQGYIHFMSLSDGSFLGRSSTDGSAILSQMIWLGDNTVLAQTRNGGLYAMTVP